MMSRNYVHGSKPFGWYARQRASNPGLTGKATATITIDSKVQPHLQGPIGLGSAWRRSWRSLWGPPWWALQCIGGAPGRLRVPVTRPPSPFPFLSRSGVGQVRATASGWATRSQVRVGGEVHEIARPGGRNL